MSVDLEQQLFQACVDAVSADERERLLQAEPDAALRERVRRLLRAHEEVPPSVLSGLQDFPRVPTPLRVGPYRILGRIGEGGMGEVFLAEQSEPVRRRVGLKILRFGLATRDVIARFELERQTLAMLTHPNIARILDAGATTDGRPYFAMEYVAGSALTRYCDDRRLDVAARLALFSQVCEGVQHAHLRGIIHRDLKPTNVLVTELDGRAVPKIIDFGIAKATAVTGDTYTRVGHLLGTPEYMSPEQAQLSPLDIDARTDVYSLGVMLYELLTGSRPYRVTGDSYDPALIAKEIVACEIARPSEHARGGADAHERARLRGTVPGALVARLAGDLDWIALRSLEKDRERRYASPAELAADLTRHARHEAVLAGPPSALYRARKFVRRHRLSVAMLSVLFVASLVFGSGMAWLARQAASARDRANEEAQVARRVTEFTAGLFELASPASSGAPTISARELLDLGVRRLTAQLDREPPDVRAALLEAAGNAYRGLGVYPQAGRLLGAAVQLRREAAAVQPAAYAKAVMNLALLERDEGALQRADALARESIDILSRAGARHWSALQRARLDLADILRRRSELADGERIAAAVIDAYERAGAEAGERAQALYVLGRIQSAQGRLAESEALLARALELHVTSERGLDEATLDLKSGLADTLVLRSEIARAEVLLREVVADAKSLYGELHPHVGIAWNNLGNALSDDPAKLAEAELAYTNARDVLRASVGDAHPELATVHNNLGALYLKTKEWHKSDVAHQEAIRLRSGLFESNHPHVANPKLGRALALNKLDRFAEAEALLREALGAFGSNLGDDHWRTANARMYLGVVLTNQRRFAEAARELEQSRAVLQRALGAGHPRTKAADAAIAELAAKAR